MSVQEDLLAISLLCPYGYNMSRCGYCGDQTGSRAYYASTSHLTPEYYQDLANHGWRRSGTTLYKPNLLTSCCAHYTVRLDSKAFKVSSHQRKDINRFNRFVLGDHYISMRPQSRSEALKRKQEFDLESRIHESEYSVATKSKDRPEPDHNFEVTLEEDTFTDEKYALFAEYQAQIHNEPPTRRGFTSFLCNSPLRRSTQHGKRLGSYHHCYRLDGILVAMAVLDLLPDSVSSVYFIYSPVALQKFSPGKLSALRETTLCLEQNYKWYMMGYYIHTCVKMKYKADFKPQYVLDPELYTWDLMDEDMKLKMDQRQYVSLGMERLGMPPVMKRNENDTSDLMIAQRMPGIPSIQKLKSCMPMLDSIRMKGRDGNMRPVSDYVFWRDGRDDDPSSIKGLVVDMAAALGLANLHNMAIFFRYGDEDDEEEDDI